MSTKKILFKSSSLNRLRDLVIITIVFIAVINYLPFQSRVIILCDSNNHLQENTATTTTKATTSKSLSEPTSQRRDRGNSNDGLDTQDDNHFVSRGDIYFIISEPESLRYTFKARSSRIGVPFTKTFSHIALVLAEPRDACTSTINKLEVRNNIALVERGGCSFIEKCIEIERSGGAALIVYDSDRSNDEHHIEMIYDNTSKNCSIPAVSLLGKDGYMIVHSLLALKQSRAVITIPAFLKRGESSNPPWLVW